MRSDLCCCFNNSLGLVLNICCAIYIFIANGDDYPYDDDKDHYPHDDDDDDYPHDDDDDYRHDDDDEDEGRWQRRRLYTLSARLSCNQMRYLP